MTVVLASRFDITPEAVLAVAWKGETVAIDAAALSSIAASRAAFMRYLDEDPNASVYGVNQGHGEMVGRTLDEDDRRRLARLKPLAAAVAFGEPYPHRVTRAMVLARLANLLGGHGMATPRLVEELVEMLNRGPIPCVPRQGQGGPGEILVLYTLFAELSRRFELQAAERGALINGSPAAAAVLADAALTAERRIAVAEQVLALAIVAFNAPAEHYETVLGELLGGEHDRRAFARLAALLDGVTDCGEPRPHQGPVSYRIVPHVLAQAHAAIGFARGLAAHSLSAVTHNPVYLTPDETHPRGRCLSTGGYHNSVAAPAIDGIAGAWADMCLICLRLCAGLMNGRVSGFPDFLLAGRSAGETDGHGAVGYLPMAIAGFLEEARAAATRTFISAADASVFGQDDVSTPAFLAWSKCMAAGQSLDSALAVLAVAASQALHVLNRERVPNRLADFLSLVRSRVPPVHADRVLGPEMQRLAGDLTARTFADDHVGRGVAA